MFKDASTEDEIREVATQFFEFSTKTDENNFVSYILSEQEFWLPIQLNPNLDYYEYKVVMIAVGKRMVYSFDYILGFIFFYLTDGILPAVFLVLAALTAWGYALQGFVLKQKEENPPLEEESTDSYEVEYLEEAK